MIKKSTVAVVLVFLVAATAAFLLLPLGRIGLGSGQFVLSHNYSFKGFLQDDARGAAPIEIARGESYFQLTPLASASVDALVLSKSVYQPGSDAMSAFSPVDLAIVWGPLANTDNFNRINFVHSGRSLYFEFDNTDMNWNAIWYVTNIHLIPADDAVGEELLLLEEGDVVSMEGYLVGIQGRIGDDEIEIDSSLTRFDDDSRSCEFMYVTNITRKSY